MKFISSILTAVAVICMIGFSCCKTPTKISNEYASYGFKTTCMGVDPNGNQTLRTWGNGISKSKAIEQAKRNAIQAVLFDGIIDGSGDCNKRPIVNEVNAREKYEAYFNAFFRDGGAYNKYVKLEESRTSRIKSKSSEMEAWSVVVIVDRIALKERMIEDNVIPQ